MSPQPKTPQPKTKPLLEVARDGVTVTIKWAMILGLVLWGFSKFQAMQDVVYQTQTDVAVLKKTSEDTNQLVRMLIVPPFPNQRREAMR